MPRRKRVPGLTDLSILAVARLVRAEANRVANIVVTQFVYDEIEAEDYEDRNAGRAWEREVYLSDQVDSFKVHLLSHLPPSLLEETLLRGVLAGIRGAIIDKKRRWTPTTNMTKFTREMYAVVKFSNLLAVPERRFLDLTSVPKMIRTKMYGSLKALTGLRAINLGSGSGGWVTEAYSDSFSTGIAGMTKLVSFSLHYDCTDHLLSVLADTCRGSLRILDIERSGHTSDRAVDSILRLSRLEDVNLFRTGLSVEGLGRVLVGLRGSLRHLQRGDFLCDVLDHLEAAGEEGAGDDVTLKVQEFWASEDYFFHTGEQMARAAARCPEIAKMLFMFQSQVCHLSVLVDFSNLRELDLWGGQFYSDDLCQMLEMIGTGLRKLSLVHVEEMDERALALLTVTCPNLESLGLHSCEFVDKEDGEGEDDPDSDLAFALADRIAREGEARAIKDLTTPLLDLTSLSLASKCSERQLVFLLRQCLNVREILLGIDTCVSDSVLLRTLADNPLQRLESFTAQGCKRVTMRGVEMLLSGCDDLRVLGNLSSFEAIHPMEVKMLSARLREDNVALELTGLDSVGDVAGDFGLGEEFVRFTLQMGGEDKHRPALDNSAEWAATS